MAADDNEAMNPIDDQTLAATHAPTDVDTSALQGALPLADWALIAARGPEARKFLHGQLTQDVENLAAGQARLAGYCSPKGRLLATFVLWADGAEDVLLACSADLLATTLKRLSMFVMRSKCKLSDISGSLALHGLAGDAATNWLGAAAPATIGGVAPRGAGQVIRLPDAAGVQRYLLAQPNATTDAAATADASNTSDAAAPPAGDLPVMTPAAWRWLEVQSGVIRIVAATSEKFVPQMVNLELVGGVNFQKGCFPGQEIVARSQYRGTLKRRLFNFEADTAASAGDEVFSADDAEQPAGMVALAAPLPGDGGRCSLLVEAKIAATSSTLHLHRADGPLLSLRSLPYPVPAEG